MTPLTVFDGAHLRALYWPGRAGRLMVTFDYRSEGRTGFGPDAHSTGFARQGFPQLTVRTAANDWFLNPDTEGLERALARVAADHARVHLLGYSMGGYGALRFAAALGARQAVVVSPQWAVGAGAPWDGRYAAAWDEGLGGLGSRGAPRLRGLLVLDPFVREDARHARLISARFPGLSTVRLGFGGHPAIRTLRATGGQRVVQEEAGRLGARAAALTGAHRAARRASPGWWLRLAALAEARRPGLAARARARAAGVPARPGDLQDP